MSPRANWLRVVVADDSTPVRERMVSMLEEIPRVEVVAETSDVPETIDHLRKLKPDVLILDIGMPGGSGLDALDTIHAERIPSQAIVVTNYADSEYEARARQTGALAFLNKSQDFLKAIDIIRELAEHKREASV